VTGRKDGQSNKQGNVMKKETIGIILCVAVFVLGYTLIAFAVAADR
jgi:hypothetical protein